eukprot:CAMPEP_0196251454 /NCGR_PEP_ID=MMETSP0913-20130531/47455_1 /TAXON_ID=49265 /ORGANISM="Thalassiosira rotula, Strain GSO102" /LENGTH=104 /DNA_ID=CAMNT_0041537707 /DNA_START=162 /DNA_END=473 /DNA_ORIENTATION=+
MTSKGFKECAPLVRALQENETPIISTPQQVSTNSYSPGNFLSSDSARESNISSSPTTLHASSHLATVEVDTYTSGSDPSSTVDVLGAIHPSRASSASDSSAAST